MSQKKCMYMHKHRYIYTGNNKANKATRWVWEYFAPLLQLYISEIIKTKLKKSTNILVSFFN